MHFNLVGHRTGSYHDVNLLYGLVSVFRNFLLNLEVTSENFLQVLSNVNIVFIVYNSGESVRDNQRELQEKEEGLKNRERFLDWMLTIKSKKG